MPTDLERMTNLLSRQRWTREGDGEVFDGVQLADRLTRIGRFDELSVAIDHLAGSSLRDAIKTGVSFYQLTDIVPQR